MLESWQTLHNQLHLVVMNVCKVCGLPGWPKSNIDRGLVSMNQASYLAGGKQGTEALPHHLLEWSDKYSRA